MKVVTAQNRKQDNQPEEVALFFSLAIGLPVSAIVLIWVCVHGALPYIRSHINDSEIFPNVASLYWIGQTFTLFVIVMDVLALCENSTIDEYDKMKNYQLVFLSLITIFESLGLFLSFLLAFIPLFSHFRHTNCKIIFQGYFQILCCGVVSFKQVGRKEARVWLLLNSLITPLIAALSHSGFIIGGWVSYEDRSFAISLLYFCILVFLYWSLQYMYKFSSTVLSNVRKGTCFKWFCSKRAHRDKKDNVDGNEEGDGDESQRVLGGSMETQTAAENIGNEVTRSHHEENMAANIQTLKQIGFDTIALFLMIFPLLFLYGMVSYFGFGLVIPLLPSIDRALVHIFTLGQYGFAIALFLLTYKLFSIKSGGGAQRLISNDALRYWRYLNKGSQINHPILALYRSIEILLLALKCLKKDERKLYAYLLQRKEFDLEVVSDRLSIAKVRFTKLKAEYERKGPKIPKNKIVSLINAAEILEKFAVKNVEFDRIEEEIETLHGSVKEIKDIKFITGDEQKAVKKLQEGLNEFRMTLVNVLGVPPMYLNKDKASALTAALVYQRINTSRETQQQSNGEEPRQQQQQQQQQWEVSTGEENERYSLLLSLIEEEF